ncbi:MAG: VPLPA-CTERM sorting domain-containing protein [Pseudomonadota bacterium]
MNGSCGGGRGGDDAKGPDWQPCRGFSAGLRSVRHEVGSVSETLRARGMRDEGSLAAGTPSEEWEMLGLNKGIAGLALAATIVAPGAALAVASFDSTGTVEVIIGGFSAPGGSFSSSYTPANGTDFGSTGGYASTITNDLVVPAGSGPTTTPFNAVGAFSVGFGAVSPNLVGVPSGGQSAIPPTPFPPFTPGELAFTVTAPQFESLSYQIFAQVTLDLEALADVGEFAAVEGVFVLRGFDSDGNVILDENLNARRATDGSNSGATGQLSFLEDVTIPENTTYSFVVRYSTFGEANSLAAPPPTNDIPVPAALPLLASALGVLGWMRRRKAA